MISRANYIALAPQAMQMLFAQEDYLRAQFNEDSTITGTVWELVKLRVSQLNQCAFCIDMHSTSALKQGETWQRLLGLNAWRDLPWYSTIEQAALELAEQLTLAKPINQHDYQQAVAIFGEKSLVDLTIAINAINSWNRMVKMFKPKVGSLN